MPTILWNTVGRKLKGLLGMPLKWLKEEKVLHSIDKANVLETSGLWREIVIEMSKDYPEVRLEHLYVDNAAIQLVINPKQFDVIVTENLFGDILSTSRYCWVFGDVTFGQPRWGDKSL